MPLSAALFRLFALAAVLATAAALPEPRLVGWLPSLDASLRPLGSAEAPVPWLNDTSFFPFITARGTQLLQGSAPLYLVGANLWHGAWLAAPSGRGSDRQRLEADLDALLAAGVTHVRVLGSSEGPESEPWRVVPAMQPRPGVFDSCLLDGFDFLLFSLGKRRMRATVVLGNEWPWSGGFAQYVRWADAADTADVSLDASDASTADLSSASWLHSGNQQLPFPGPGEASWPEWQALTAAFYTNERARAMWDRQVTFLLTRISRYTGVAAVQDPTVLAWELANEPRAGLPGEWKGSRPGFDAWLRTAAAHIKRLAPRQLVASGMEGDTGSPSLGQAAAADAGCGGRGRAHRACLAAEFRVAPNGRRGERASRDGGV